MIYILLSIFCSVTVAVFLKLARRYKINVIQAVTWNYLFAILFSLVFFRPKLGDLLQAPSPIYIGLGILLPLVFWILAASIKNIGIAKSDIAQRLSLFIPILASYFLFKENISGLKLAGLLTGIVAILLTLFKKQGKRSGGQISDWIYPTVVFIGFGIIDVLFKKIAQVKSMPFTTSLVLVFGLSFVISLIAIGYLAIVKKQKLELVNFLCGCILGAFNFGNIFFYLKAHQALASNPSTVFAAMNMGVIILGSLIGLIIFKEKFIKINYIGLLLALASIILITLAQLHAF